MSDTILTTARLRLRTWDDAGFAEFLRVTNTPAVMRWLGGVMNAETAAGLRTRLDKIQNENGFTFWLLETLQNNEILGWCGLKLMDAPGSTVPGAHEIGWRLREDMWGKGYAREAASGCLDYGFDRLGAKDIYAITVAGNKSSWGLMERLAMTRRADLDYVDARFGADLNPTIVYRITAEDRNALATCDGKAPTPPTPIEP